MADMNHLSFLPDDYLERKAQRRANAIMAVLFLLVMGGVVSAFVLSERSSKAVKAAAARSEEQYLTEAKRLEQVRQMQEKQRRMAHQAELSASLLERVPRSFVLAEITNSMPAGVSLLELLLDAKPRQRAGVVEAVKSAYEQRKNAAKPAAGPTALSAEPKLYDVSLKITGVAHTDVQVAQLLNRLGRSTLLKDVNLLVSEEHTQGEEKLRKFQIEMMLRPDAEVSLDQAKARSAAVELKE